MDGAILCAAVADYTPAEVSSQKIKRKGEMQIKLKPTRDIAKSMGQIKRERQVLVGFALETEDEKTNAQKKLKSKNLDFIVLNSLSEKGAGFKVDTNKIMIIEASGREMEFQMKPKVEVAKDIIDRFIEYTDKT
jgi:phosphopantothenoylcysteine decarboxylase/phosphopantothenate--cysteine ligase